MFKVEPSKTLILAEIMKDSTNLILTSLDAFFDDKLGGEGLSMDRFFFSSPFKSASRPLDNLY